MKSGYAIAALLLFASTSTLATTCEESFKKSGNPFTGTSYTASVTVPGLSVDSAIKQMRAIAVNKKMDVLNEDAAGGSLLIEEPSTVTHKPLSFIITASNDGEVSMLLKLNKGAFGGSDSIRQGMCEMMAQVRAGQAGEALANQADVAVKPVEISAPRLSDKIDFEAKDNRAAIGARYAGKVFLISGTSADVRKEDGKYVVVFKTIFDRDDPVGKTRVLCRMATNQTAFALSIKEGDNLKLTGSFDTFDYGAVDRDFILKDCKAS
jgi:hypothetical protein